jgi:hypothetical protein
MFQTEDYVQNSGYQKIRYILRLAGMYTSDVASILELDLDFVGKVLGSGVVQTTSDQASIDWKFYNFLVLQDYLLKIANYDINEYEKLWKETSIYDNAIVKPPWYKWGLRKYLETHKYKGLESCIDWIRRY